MIKLILFDIGKVVTQNNFLEAYKNFGLRIGLSPDSVSLYHKEHLHDLLLGKIGFNQFCNDMKSLGSKSSLNYKEIWMEEMLKNTKVEKEVIDTIIRLRNKYKVGVLSNLTESRLLVDEALRIYDNFDYVFLSCKEGLKKPDFNFYKLALDKTKVKPEETVFIDDKEMCIEPAKQLGVKTILFTSNSELIKQFHALGVVI